VSIALRSAARFCHVTASRSADRARHPAVAVPPAQPSQRRRRRAPLPEIQLPGRQTPPTAPTALVDGNHVAGKVVGTGDEVIVRHRVNITPGRLARCGNFLASTGLSPPRESVLFPRHMP
jgi:hypothetical protein